jgi:hypothetical protein
MHWERLDAFFSGSPLSAASKAQHPARKSLVPSFTPVRGYGNSPRSTTTGESIEVDSSEHGESLGDVYTAGGDEEAEDKMAIADDSEDTDMSKEGELKATQPTAAGEPAASASISALAAAPAPALVVGAVAQPARPVPTSVPPSSFKIHRHKHSSSSAAKDPWSTGSMAIAKALEDISRSTKQEYSSNIIRTAVSVLCKEYENTLDTDGLVNAVLLLENETKANVFLGLAETPSVRDAWLKKQL